MKIHTTNYQETFITAADDCPALVGEIPPRKGDAKSVANLQFDLLNKNPYRFTYDDVLFQVHAERNDLTEGELASAREQFFSKGQPCFRASALPKRYGWGIHYDKEGKMALYSVGSDSYERLKNDPTLRILKAIRSKKD